MAHLQWSFLSMASLLFLADSIHASPSSSSSSFPSHGAAGSGSVLFLDGNTRPFLRPASKMFDLQANAFSGSDVWSAIAVLLGISPRLDMSASSASKLEKLLFPDPFNHPRAVLALTLPHLNTDVLDERFPKVFEADSYKVYPLIADNKEMTKLPVTDVRVEYLTSFDNAYHKPSLRKDQLDDLAHILGGKYVNSSGGAISLALPMGLEYELSLSKKGDHYLVAELINLVETVRRSLDARKGLHRVPQISADLLLGMIRAEQLAGGSLESQAPELLLFIVSKLVLALETVYEGELVAVLIMPVETGKASVEDILGMDLSMGTSRLLAEESSDKAYEVEKLARNALVTVTAVILIVAALFGSYLLFNMPLTRDTLLYSGAKLD